MLIPTGESLRGETELALRAARSGLALATSGAGAERISSKGGRDVVTDADIAVEELIRGTLGEASAAPVIGEEHGGAKPDDGSPYWLVDPICGTRNYASGIPLYCVNVALVENERVALAAVGDPSTDEVQIAESGLGAWALRSEGWHRLSASPESLTIVIEANNPARLEHSARFVAAAIRADRWDIRAFSTTLVLPYLAAGRVSAYVLFGISAVHSAAGSLLASEAGAALSDLDGRPWTIAADSLVAAATVELAHELLELIATTREA